MAFIDNILHKPSFGWKNAIGKLVVPSKTLLCSEVFLRNNIFQSKKNWISVANSVMDLSLIPFLSLFLFYSFSWWIVVAIVIYSMMVAGTQGTIWFHRYCTQKSYSFLNNMEKLILKNIFLQSRW